MRSRVSRKTCTVSSLRRKMDVFKERHTDLHLTIIITLLQRGWFTQNTVLSDSRGLPFHFRPCQSAGERSGQYRGPLITFKTGSHFMLKSATLITDWRASDARNQRLFLFLPPMVFHLNMFFLLYLFLFCIILLGSKSHCWSLFWRNTTVLKLIKWKKYIIV